MGGSGHRLRFLGLRDRPQAGDVQRVGRFYLRPREVVCRLRRMGRGAAGEPVASVRWEAWREGVEDYEYLHALRCLVAEGRRHGVDRTLVARGASTLDAVVGEVLASGADSTVVYLARRRLTEAILLLQDAIDTLSQR